MQQGHSVLLYFTIVEATAQNMLMHITMQCGYATVPAHIQVAPPRPPDMKHFGSADPEASLCFGRSHCISHSRISAFDPDKLPLTSIPVP